jgi:hypothetical protein
MDRRRFVRRIRWGDFIYGSICAVVSGINCYVAAIIYPQIPDFVFAVVTVLGFLAGFFFGSTAILTILSFLGAV